MNQIRAVTSVSRTPELRYTQGGMPYMLSEDALP